MSVILKVPYVHKILSVLTHEQLSVLESYINGNTLPSKVRVSLDKNDANVLNETFKGVSYVEMNLDTLKRTTLNGFLCYKDSTHCCLFAIHSGDSEVITTVKINPIDLTYKYINEGLDIEELRREVYDLFNTGSSITVTQFEETKNYVDSIKETIVAHEGTEGFTEIQIGHNLEVDGKIIINSGDDIIDSTGSPVSFGKISLKELNLIETSNGSRVFESAQNIFSGKHVHIMFEIEGTGVHAGADFDLHPYNGSICIVTFPITVNGATINGFAHIGDNGKIVINVDSIASGSTMTAIAHYFIYN